MSLSFEFQVITSHKLECLLVAASNFERRIQRHSIGNKHLNSDLMKLLVQQSLLHSHAIQRRGFIAEAKGIVELFPTSFVRLAIRRLGAVKMSNERVPSFACHLIRIYVRVSEKNKAFSQPVIISKHWIYLRVPRFRTSTFFSDLHSWICKASGHDDCLSLQFVALYSKCCAIGSQPYTTYTTYIEVCQLKLNKRSPGTLELQNTIANEAAVVLSLCDFSRFLILFKHVSPKFLFFNLTPTYRTSKTANFHQIGHTMHPTCRRRRFAS